MKSPALLLLPGLALVGLLLAALPAAAQTVTIAPHQQARYAATADNLGKVQNSIISDAESGASKQFGFVAGEYPEEFRNVVMFKLDDSGLASAKVATATLEIAVTHQLGDRPLKIAVAQLLPAPGRPGFVFNNYSMYQEPEGEALLKEGDWTTHRIEITQIFKAALDDADENAGLVLMVWLDESESGALVDYQGSQILRTSLGSADFKIEVEQKP